MSIPLALFSKQGGGVIRFVGEPGQNSPFSVKRPEPGCLYAVRRLTGVGCHLMLLHPERLRALTNGRFHYNAPSARTIHGCRLVRRLVQVQRQPFLHLCHGRVIVLRYRPVMDTGISHRRVEVFVSQ